MEQLQLQHHGEIVISRDANGIPEIKAETESGLYYGQGFAQARDRGRQILLMRILAQGRGSELLDSSDEMLEIDRFFRKMNWSGDAGSMVNSLDKQSSGFLDSFCEGMNAYFTKKLPFEFKYLLRVPFEPIRPDHVITISRMIGYISLAQSQGEVERLLVQMVQAGVDRKLLDELFPGSLGKMDEDMMRQVKLKERMVPESLQWNRMIPRLLASNNWVIGPKKSASGKAMLCNDPHLEINRLPNVWQEIVLTIGSRTASGVCMPGIPGLLIGRNPDVSWGVTYTFMDAIDSWMEECRHGSFKRSVLLIDHWVPFKQRREVIKRKKKPDHLEIFYENEHGVLDGNPNDEGFYLATRWASGSGTGPTSLKAIFSMFHVRNVKDAMDTMGQLEMSFNWVFADNQGNIGYQMSGLMPKRHKNWSGLPPMPGNDSSYDWKGFVHFKDLPRAFNPKEGYIVTANDDLNHLGKTAPINLSMGSYRAERIARLLKDDNLDVEHMKKIQMDVYSIQAEKFMEIIRPLLPENNQNAATLDAWDFTYSPESRGAFIFEKIYEYLIDEVFGNVLGMQIINHLRTETGILVDFFSYFDRILLSKKSRWFYQKKREEIFKTAIDRALKEDVRPYGKKRDLPLLNILLGGKFPGFLGIDRGPIPLPGGRATPHQGQIYRSAGRLTSFAPSYRMVVDFAEPGILTSLIGGPSDNPFSRWYASDVERWQKGDLKRVGASS